MSTAAFPDSDIQHFHNIELDNSAAWPSELDSVLDRKAMSRAQDEISSWPKYAPTPLHLFPGLARKLGLGAIYYKDESDRFGLGSFKALGGAYAVLCLLQEQVSRQLGRDISFEDLRNGSHKQLLNQITVATATDGNHGRSVAWGAQQFGCKCVIYIHKQVSKGRENAVMALGAKVVRVEGNYDESVRQVAVDALDNHWFIVSDTSYEDYTEIPKQVIAGYTVLMAEIDNQLPITHVIVQGGVGGLACAVFAYLWQRFHSEKPRFIIVEPEWAACLYDSARQGHPTSVQIEKESVMAGLSCGEVSTIAWDVIYPSTNDYLTISDDLVAPTMRALAAGIEGANPVVAGESAVAGLALLLATERNPGLASALGLELTSHVLLLGTEGATDPDIYHQIVNLA